MISASEIVSEYTKCVMDPIYAIETYFKTYDKTPEFQGISSYCDTADEGKDFLCNIIYGMYNHEAYVLDVYYTKDAMEKTEPETANRLTEYKVNNAKVESNNGGRGFARSVQKELDTRHNYITIVKWFHQSKNKEARILTNATWIMEHMYFPENWRDRWPEYYEAMTSYQKEGKNAHDDAPDASTGVAESFDKEKIGAVNIKI